MVALSALSTVACTCTKTSAGIPTLPGFPTKLSKQPSSKQTRFHRSAERTSPFHQQSLCQEFLQASAAQSDIDTSGSTVIFVYYEEQDILVANVGGRRRIVLTFFSFSGRHRFFLFVFQIHAASCRAAGRPSNSRSITNPIARTNALASRSEKIRFFFSQNLKMTQLVG